MIPDKYHYYLYALAKAHSIAQRKRLILAADPQIIKLLCEIALNILEGNIKLTPTHINRLKPFRTSIRRLVRQNLKLKEKQKKLSNQKGGFLPLLIPAIASIAGGLLGSVFRK